jgi:hypothetical protein
MARQGSKRDTVSTPTGTFYAKRGTDGRFEDLAEKGKALAADRRKKAATKVKSGYGHKGDRE